MVFENPPRISLTLEVYIRNFYCRISIRPYTVMIEAIRGLEGSIHTIPLVPL